MIRAARADRITGMAAEISYFAMLSLVPAVVALAAALTVVGEVAGSDIESRVVDWIGTASGARARKFVASVRALFDRPNGDVALTAGLIALWSGSRGIDAVVRSVVLVGRDVERRPWWRRRALSVAMLAGSLAAAAVGTAMLVVGPLLGGGHVLAARFGLGSAFTTAWAFARLPLAFVALAAWALVLLHVSRPHAGRWRDDVSGAVTAAVLWVAASLGLRAYLQFAGTSNPALGALGGPVIALMWFYLVALALLVGAEVAEETRRRRRGKTAVTEVASPNRAAAVESSGRRGQPPAPSHATTR